MFENVDRRTTDTRRTDDGRTTEARVIGILIAHLGAFGSGELKKTEDYTVQKHSAETLKLCHNNALLIVKLGYGQPRIII